MEKTAVTIPIIDMYKAFQNAWLCARQALTSRATTKATVINKFNEIHNCCIVVDRTWGNVIAVRFANEQQYLTFLLKWS